MIKIEIKTNAREVLPIVQNIRDDGMETGKDFDFYYMQARHDPINGHLIEEPKVVLMFYNQEYALIFRLKHDL